MKKFLTVMLLAVAIIFVSNNSANAAVEKIDSGLNFQQMGIGSIYNATVVNCNEWISLREYPSTSAARLAKVPLGARVEITVGTGETSAYDSPQNGFYYTKYNGIWGWCLQQYISRGSYITGYAG